MGFVWLLSHQRGRKVGKLWGSGRRMEASPEKPNQFVISIYVGATNLCKLCASHSEDWFKQVDANRRVTARAGQELGGRRGHGVVTMFGVRVGLQTDGGG